MTGLSLYELLFNSLDLPETIKASKLEELLVQNNITREELTIEHLREMVAELLHSLILEDQDDSSFPQ